MVCLTLLLSLLYRLLQYIQNSVLHPAVLIGQWMKSLSSDWLNSTDNSFQFVWFFPAFHWVSPSCTEECCFCSENDSQSLTIIFIKWTTSPAIHTLDKLNPIYPANIIIQPPGTLFCHTYLKAILNLADLPSIKLPPFQVQLPATSMSS